MDHELGKYKALARTSAQREIRRGADSRGAPRRDQALLYKTKRSEPLGAPAFDQGPSLEIRAIRIS